MADATRIVAIDNAGPNADGSYDIIAQNPCRRVTAQEDYDSATAATADLRQKAPASAASAVKIAKGTPAIYTPVWKTSGDADPKFDAGEKVGTIKTSAGSINLQIVESLQV